MGYDKFDFDIMIQDILIIEQMQELVLIHKWSLTQVSL